MKIHTEFILCCRSFGKTKPTIDFLLLSYSIFLWLYRLIQNERTKKILEKFSIFLFHRIFSFPDPEFCFMSYLIFPRRDRGKTYDSFEQKSRTHIGTKTFCFIFSSRPFAVRCTTHQKLICTIDYLYPGVKLFIRFNHRAN